MGLFISLLGIFLMIAVVVGTHEFAHFAVARVLGVKVLRFSIGFGKTLCRFKDKQGTEYAFSLIPLGGYVKMLDENESQVPDHQLAFAFNRQPFYKKFLIVLAGPLTNILCALILYWVIYMVGFVVVKPIIGSLTPHSIAATAGLQAQQEIVKIDGHPITSWTSVIFRTLAHAGNQDHLSMQVKNFNSAKTVTYYLDLSDWHMDNLTPDPIASLGITPLIPEAKAKWPEYALQRIQYEPLRALQHAFLEMNYFTYFNLLIIEKILTGKLSLQSLGGPITIFESAGDALNSGVLAYISFLAFISISIGIINLIPIPGLDGGHLLIFTIEWIIRRPIPVAYLNLLYRLGLILVFLVLIQALVNDVLRL